MTGGEVCRKREEVDDNSFSEGVTYGSNAKTDMSPLQGGDEEMEEPSEFHLGGEFSLGLLQ